MLLIWNESLAIPSRRRREILIGKNERLGFINNYYAELGRQAGRQARLTFRYFSFSHDSRARDPRSFSNSFISLPFSLVLSFCRSNRYTCTNAASSFVHFFFHVTTAGKRAGRINISHRRFDLVLVAVAASFSYPSKVVLIISSESKSGDAK